MAEQPHTITCLWLYVMLAQCFKNTMQAMVLNAPMLVFWYALNCGSSSTMWFFLHKSWHLSQCERIGGRQTFTMGECTLASEKMDRYAMKQLAPTFTGKYPQKNAIKAIHRSNLTKSQHTYFHRQYVFVDRNDTTTLCVCHL